MRNAIATKVRLVPTCLLSLAFLVGGAAMGQEYWVSAAGSDADAGTKDMPFATLERARDAVRETKKAGGLPKGGVTVWLQSGVYEISKTFELNDADSGTAESPVVYRSVPGGEVRISGGKRIPSTTFKTVTDTDLLARLDPAARDHVVQADLRSLGITDFGKLNRRGGIRRDTFTSALELFFNDQPMTLARWPNNDWAKIVAVPEGPACDRITYGGERPRRWRNLENIWLHGYPTRNWCDTYEQVIAIDLEKREITTSETYDSKGVKEGYKAGQRYYFLNILEELDEPGEWYLDRHAGILYFWPPSPIAQGATVVSLLEAPMVELQDAEHITLRGLTLEVARGSGVKILGGHHNLIAGCTLRNLSTVGIAIGDMEGGYRIYKDDKTDAGTDNGVVSCDIYNMGEYGIILGGGDRKTLEPGRNYAVNNRIYNFGRWVRTYRPAVLLCGVGNRVAHNLMHDAPHTAVFFLGNDHVLEFNEIYRVCTETGDAGAFYTGRDWSQRGSIVRHNYFHDLRATLQDDRSFSAIMGVYLDDQASGITVFGNVFCRVNCAVLLGGGRDNTLENNIFAFCDRAIHLDARGVGDNLSNSKTLLDRLKAVKHDRPPYSERYPALAGILDDEPGVPKGNVVARNICVEGPWDVFYLAAGQEFVRTPVKMENNLTQGDPGLVAPQKGDFRLKEDSPALKLGFKPIPIEKIGLYQDEYR